ncbi:hypothetical protein J6590_106596, partial [Homalodisca vitripennis]
GRHPRSKTTTSLTRADIILPMSTCVPLYSRALCCQLADILAVRPPRHSHVRTFLPMSTCVPLYIRALCCQLEDIPSSTTTTSLTRADISAYIYTDSRPLICQLPDILAVCPPRHSHVRTHLPISILIVERCVASCQTSPQYDHHSTVDLPVARHPRSMTTTSLTRADTSTYIYTDSRALCCQLADILAVRPPRHSHVRTYLPMSTCVPLYTPALCCQLADIPSSTTTTSITRADISAYVYVRTTVYSSVVLPVGRHP